MFIRLKNIKGKNYAYKVENLWKRGKTKQKVKKYLGRCFTIGDTEPIVLTKNTRQALIHELQGIINEYTEEIVVDIKELSVKHKNRSAVLMMNGGYLCRETLNEFKKSLYLKNEEQPGVALATACRNAGINLVPESFVQLYKVFQ